MNKLQKRAQIQNKPAAENVNKLLGFTFGPKPHSGLQIMFLNVETNDCFHWKLIPPQLFFSFLFLLMLLFYNFDIFLPATLECLKWLFLTAAADWGQDFQGSLF